MKVEIYVEGTSLEEGVTESPSQNQSVRDSDPENFSNLW
jgi:hypothetical protein